MSDSIKDFKPSLREIGKCTWEASIELPVIGRVATQGNGWKEAKIRLWLVSEAMKAFAAKSCKDPSEWSEAEWRSTLKAMHDVMSPN